MTKKKTTKAPTTTPVDPTERRTVLENRLAEIDRIASELQAERAKAVYAGIDDSELRAKARENDESRAAIVGAIALAFEIEAKLAAEEAAKVKKARRVEAARVAKVAAEAGAALDSKLRELQKAIEASYAAAFKLEPFTDVTGVEISRLIPSFFLTCAIGASCPALIDLADVAAPSRKDTARSLLMTWLSRLVAEAEEEA